MILLDWLIAYIRRAHAADGNWILVVLLPIVDVLSISDMEKHKSVLLMISYSRGSNPIWKFLAKLPIRQRTLAYNYVLIHIESKNASCDFLLLRITLVVTPALKTLLARMQIDLYQIFCILKSQLLAASVFIMSS